jgi:hypothetical protein
MDSFMPIFEKIGQAFVSKKPLRSQNIRDWFRKFEIQTFQYDNQQKGYEVIKWFEDLKTPLYIFNQ